MDWDCVYTYVEWIAESYTDFNRKDYVKYINTSHCFCNTRLILDHRPIL